MEYRIIRKDLKVSGIGLGCMGMSHAYGAPSDHREMSRLLADAVRIGYTFFDTAEVYGTSTDPHDNEKLLGEGLKPYRNEVVIATKFGLTFGEKLPNGMYSLVPDSKPETIRMAVEGSLRRLQTDHIDLYYQHRVDPEVSPETVAEVMADLIKEGKILHWGVSEAQEDYIRRAHAVCPMTAIQNRYSMMARWNESLFPMCKELGIGFVAFSPLANGLLTNSYTADSKFDPTTDYRASMPQYTKEGFDKNRQLLDLIASLAESHNATSSQISLAWMICKEPFIVPIPGTRTVSRLEENAGASEIKLSASEVEDIDKRLSEMSMSDVFGGNNTVKN